MVKWIKSFTILCFCLVMIVPIAAFNTQPDVVSKIDNRNLTENPFFLENGRGLTENIENYISDRIGFRDEMILGYTILNDRLFGKMVHPNYQYGQDGHVFGQGFGYIGYSNYHETFADMVQQLQNYCTDRDIPFLMVFNPAKPAVLTEYIPEGMYYNRDWADQLMQALDDRGVNYLDNTQTLRKRKDMDVFNQKFDADHWNDLGAYYGVTEAVRILQKDIPAAHVTTQDEMTISQTLQTTLTVSEFPIEEYVRSALIDMTYENLTGDFIDELELDPSFRGFGYYRNSERRNQGAPRALVFQGSYMTNYGYKYLINAFGDYIYVQDYQNIFNLDYYCNIFQPECVIFEVAEYTLSDTFFSEEGMRNMRLNQRLADVEEQIALTGKIVIDEDDLSVQEGKTLTKIIWNTDQPFKYVWLAAAQEYDFRECEAGYEVTLQTADYQTLKSGFEIVALDEGENKLIDITIEK